MNTIKLLGIELDEDQVMSKVENRTKPSVFNERFFSDQLDELGELVARYATMGKEFKKEYIEYSRMYNALIKIDEWFKDHNSSENFGDDIVKVKKLVHAKTYYDKGTMFNTKFKDYVYIGGLYTVVEMYIIPFERVKYTYPDKSLLETMRRVSLDMCKPTLKDPDREYNNYNLPEDGNYGTSRAISPTHFALFVHNQDNPFANQISRMSQWRYILPDGSAI